MLVAHQRRHSHHAPPPTTASDEPLKMINDRCDFISIWLKPFYGSKWCVSSRVSHSIIAKLLRDKNGRRTVFIVIHLARNWRAAHIQREWKKAVNSIILSLLVICQVQVHSRPFISEERSDNSQTNVRNTNSDKEKIQKFIAVVSGRKWWYSSHRNRCAALKLGRHPSPGFPKRSHFSSRTMTDAKCFLILHELNWMELRVRPLNSMCQVAINSRYDNSPHHLFDHL